MCIVRKVFISISLFAIIPFLTTLYLNTNIWAHNFSTKSFIVFIASFICVLGAVLLFKLTHTLAKLYNSINIIAKGDINHKAQVEKSSGISDLAISINQVSQRLRESADELEMRAILIKRFNQEIKKRNKLGSMSVSDIIHELRAPLINIDKSSSILLERRAGDINAEQDNFLRIINNNAKRLIHLTSDFLDFFKMESSEFALHCELLSLEEVILAAANSVGAWRESKNLKLETKIIEGIPRIFADKDKLIQVIVNLLSNAIKFTPAGGKISIEAKIFENEKEIRQLSGQNSNETFIEISVQDTGIGIPDSKKDTIFERFSASGGSSLDAVPSTGLGLPIAKQIVQMHNGRIWVESQPGKGTKVSFIIPEGLKRQARGARPIMKQERRILIIDDENEVRDLLGRELDKRGYFVTTAQDGIEALKKILEHNYDLVITDIRMPHIDGGDCIKILKKINPDISFIVITGFPVEHDLGEMLKREAWPCISKPFDLPELLHKVENPLN